MSLYVTPRRQRFWRFIILLILLNVLLWGILAWYRDWQTVDHMVTDVRQEFMRRAPTQLTVGLPPVEPPRPRSDIAKLVNTELYVNPQSDAFTADLYMTTNLDQVVPWPNVGGRTEVLSHTIESGDTLYGIAFTYDLDLNSLLGANPELSAENPLIQIGQQLRILPVQGVYHFVTETDTIESIAAQYGVPPTNITNYPPNNLTRPFELTIGQGLIIPYGRRPNAEGELPPVQVDSRLVWPLIGPISKGFNVSRHPGLLINAPAGAIVQAAGEGTIKSINRNQGGVILVIDHGNGLESWYGNLQDNDLTPNTPVTSGQTIGQIANTGNRGIGSHLYFAVYLDGEPVDPLGYLPGGSLPPEEATGE